MSTAQLGKRVGAPGEVDLFHPADPRAGVRGA